MKKIPKVITQEDRSVAFQEGRRAYQEGMQSWSNPYLGENEELIRAWLDGWLEGWQAARAGDHQKGHHSAPPTGDDD